jgi:hypothetical protein
MRNIYHYAVPEGLFLNVRNSNTHRSLILTALATCFVTIRLAPKCQAVTKKKCRLYKKRVCIDARRDNFGNSE